MARRIGCGVKGRRSYRGVWLDTRFLLGLVLVTASMAGGLALYRATRTTSPVLVAVRDLQPGEVVSSDAFRAGAARLEPAQAATVLTPADLEGLAGRYVTRRIGRNELVTSGSLGRRPVPTRLFSMTLPAAAAVGGDLDPGDEVDVLATVDKGTADARTVVVAERARVVRARPTRGQMGAGAGIEIGLDLTRDQVLAAAFALNNGAVNLALSTGSPAEAGAATEVASIDLAGAPPPPPSAPASGAATKGNGR